MGFWGELLTGIEEKVVRLHGQQLLIDGGLHSAVITLTRGPKINTKWRFIGAKLARSPVHSQKMLRQAEKHVPAHSHKRTRVQVLFLLCQYLCPGSRFSSNWTPLHRSFFVL